MFPVFCAIGPLDGRVRIGSVYQGSFAQVILAGIPVLRPQQITHGIPCALTILLTPVAVESFYY